MTKAEIEALKAILDEGTTPLYRVPLEVRMSYPDGRRWLDATELQKRLAAFFDHFVSRGKNQ